MLVNLPHRSPHYILNFPETIPLMHRFPTTPEKSFMCTYLLPCTGVGNISRSMNAQRLRVPAVDSHRDFICSCRLYSNPVVNLSLFPVTWRWEPNSTLALDTQLYCTICIRSYDAIVSAPVFLLSSSSRFRDRTRTLFFFWFFVLPSVQNSIFPDHF